MQPEAVKSNVTADGEAERLYGLDGVPRVAPVPYFDERILHDVLCFFTAQRDAEGKSEKGVLHRQDVATKTYLFHLCSDRMTFGRLICYNKRQCFNMP